MEHLQLCQMGDVNAIISDVIALGLAFFTTGNTPNLFLAWSRNLFSIVRQLDGIAQVPILIFNRYNLVNCTQSWLIVGGNQLGPYAPDINLGLLHFQVEDGILIQIIGSVDFSIGEACFIQLLANLFGNIG